MKKYQEFSNRITNSHESTASSTSLGVGFSDDLNKKLQFLIFHFAKYSISGWLLVTALFDMLERTFIYNQGVRDDNFSENFAYVLNE